MNVLPENDSERGDILLATCLLDYFPNACAAVARHSAKSNDKHNPGQPPHWARDKSTDHRNKIARHLIDAGGFDKDGNRHSVAIAWRGLALLEDELIAEGATPGRNAVGSPPSSTRQRYDETSAIAAAQDAKLDGIPAESAYLVGTGSSKPAPVGVLGYGLAVDGHLAARGDVPIRTPVTDEHGDVVGWTTTPPRHVMHAEAIRDHDERLSGPEDQL